MLDKLKNTQLATPALAYGMFALATIAVGVHILGFIPEQVMLALLGLFGFSGIAAWRAFIQSPGLKTYLGSALGIIGIIANGAFPDIVTPDILIKWLTAIGTLTTVSAVHGTQKAQKELAIKG